MGGGEEGGGRKGEKREGGGKVGREGEANGRREGGKRGGEEGEETAGGRAVEVTKTLGKSDFTYVHTYVYLVCVIVVTISRNETQYIKSLVHVRLRYLITRKNATHFC